jgi:hypothetical protein
MTISLIPKSEVEKSRLNEQIVKETALQVIKDFAMFGMEIRFPENIYLAYDELYEQLTAQIEELMKRDPEKLSSLLYQIDLDEQKVKNPEIEVFHEHEWMSQLILEREFLKVLTRHYFKNVFRK